MSKNVARIEFLAPMQRRIRKGRVALGWSQPKMARELGISVERYKKWENRRGSAMPDQYRPLFERIIGKPPGYLVNGPDVDDAPFRAEPEPAPHPRRVARARRSH